MNTLSPVRRTAVDRLAAIALGSNLADREENLERARALIAARMGDLVRVSRIYETDPIGPAGQAQYLNQVALVDTPREPEELLELGLAIEAEIGRRRTTHWGPRTIDLDLLLHGARVRSSAALTLPHPRLHERPFVLVPLAEILPAWHHPLRGQTVRELQRAQGCGGVRPWTGEFDNRNG